MSIVVVDFSKMYPDICFINSAVSGRCSLPLCGRWDNSRFVPLLQNLALQSRRRPWFKHCTIVWHWGLCLCHVCLHMVPMSLACSWLDRALGLCPFWCSVTAGMGWGSQTWQQAKWVGGLLLLYWAIHLHLCICSPSPQTNLVKGNGTHGSGKRRCWMWKY